MLIHSYKDDVKTIPLSIHLANTGIIILETSLYKRIQCLANRLVPDQRRRQKILSYILLSPLLHDIGKAMKLYQDRPVEWRKGYFLHEIISSIIVDKLLEESCREQLIRDTIDLGLHTHIFLKCLITLPILRHHYAARDLSEYRSYVNAIVFIKKDYLRVNGNSISVILDDILDRIGNAIPEYTKFLLKRMSKSTRILDDICFDESTIRKELTRFLQVNAYLSMFSNKKPSPKLFLPHYIASLTGILSLADYLCGSIERSGRPHGYPVKVLSSREIEYVKNRVFRV